MKNIRQEIADKFDTKLQNVKLFRIGTALGGGVKVNYFSVKSQSDVNPTQMFENCFPLGKSRRGKTFIYSFGLDA